MATDKVVMCCVFVFIAVIIAVRPLVRACAGAN
jgi:hypothetical protein